MKKYICLFLICCIYLTGCGQSKLVNKESSSDNMPYESDDISDDMMNNNAKESDFINEDEIINDMSITVLGDKEFENKILELKEDINQNKRSDIEIRFNNIPWGINYNSVDDAMWKIDGFNGMSLQNIPVPFDNLLGLNSRFSTELYDCENIGGITWCSLDHMTVAGYEVDECRLLFAGIETKEGFVLSEENSVFYGAYYVIKGISDNLKAQEDLVEKLITVYGEPSKTIKYKIAEESDYTIEYMYWFGENGTVLTFYQNTISYVWLGGEELLNDALDYAEKKQQEDAEKVYGDGDTTGL